MAPPPEQPPAPGPEPQAPKFPFAEAAALRSAMATLKGDLSTLKSRHETAATSARHDFEGDPRTDFDDQFGEHLGYLDNHISGLDGDIGELDRVVKLAQARAQQYQTDHAAWAKAKKAYDSAQQPATTGGG